MQMRSSNKKIIINFTPTGMIPTKKMTPTVPISINEIIEDMHRACEIGITMVHLHARDEITGAPTFRAEVYAKIIEGIRKFAPELVICVSLSGRNYNEFEKRAEPLFLEGPVKPDMGSLTLSSLNFNQVASLNEPAMIKKLTQTMLEKKIKPELEVFDVGMINYAKYLAKKKLLIPPFYFNLILGNTACAQADLLHVGVIIRDLPDNSFWSIGGVGNAQLFMNMLAIAAGGGVRIGLEDNIWFDAQRTRLATNADYLQRIHRIISAAECELMPASEMRKMLNLLPGRGQYGQP